MQIEFENLTNESFISSFGSKYIIVSNKKYFKAVIIYNNRINNTVEENTLFSKDFLTDKISGLSNSICDFILFGTGHTVLNIPIEIINLICKKKIPFEIMNSNSAYKTYNILISQERKILAFLKLES